MMEILSVAVGGALGAVCRYLLGNFISRASGSALPWGTFAINIIGCFWDCWLREQACWRVKGYEADAVRNKQHL